MNDLLKFAIENDAILPQIPGASSLTPLSSPVDPLSPLSSVIGAAASASPSLDLLCDLGGLDLNKPAAAAPAPAPAPAAVKSDDPWGDFASADNGAKTSGNWVQF